PPEGVCRMLSGERGPPFEELVAGAERQATRSHEDEQPTTGPQRRRAQQDLANQDGGDEALDEVTEAVVVVPRQAEQVLNPEAQGHTGVGVVAADDEDECMDGEQGVGERGQRKAASREHQDWTRDQHRKDLEPPRSTIVRRNAGHDERRTDENHEHTKVPAGHWVQLMAAEAMGSGLPRWSHRPDTWRLGQRGERKGRESEGQTGEGGARAHRANIVFPRCLATDSRLEPDIYSKPGGAQTRTHANAMVVDRRRARPVGPN